MERWKDYLIFLLGLKKEETKEKLEKFFPEVIVMIPAYNEEKTIKDTIISIKNQSYPIKEIIVIDDSSTDNTFQIAQSLGVRVIRTPKNTGTKAQAQNYGLKFIENTDVLVTVDADTILESKAIEKIIYALKDKKVISACGFVIPQKIETFWERVRLIQYLIYIPLAKKTQEYWKVPLVSSGCFSAFNFEILKKLGGFPSETFVEDMALSWQALIEGYNIKVVPEAICYPKDPNVWSVYRRQLLRWNRGFLQCLRFHRKKILKNKRLAFFAYWYLINGLLSPFFWSIMIYSLYQLIFYRSLTTIYSWIGIFFILEIGLNFFYALFYGKKTKLTKKVLSSFPLYLVSGIFDLYLFWEAVIGEWMLKSKMVWEKGH